MQNSFSLHTTADELEARIRANRLLDVPVSWQDELIFPYYNGLSIMNMAQTISVLLGAPAEKPLDDAVWGGESPVGQIQRVLLVISDGLGYQLLKKLVESDPTLRDDIASITGGRGFVPISSVAPSTTACALPTMWTGNSPAAHGMLGTFLYLREFSMLGDLLEFAPALGVNPTGTFERWGISAEDFITVPSLAQNLQTVGVPTYTVLQHALIKSGLSRQLHRGIAKHHPHAGTDDAWLRLTDVLTMTRGQKCCIGMYWPLVDGLSHMYGAESRYVVNEIKYQMNALSAVLNLDVVRDGQTLVIITADHGHHDAPQAADLRVFADSMRGTFGGDDRFGYLYLREGHKQRMIDRLSSEFAETLAWFDPQTALDAGLFGMGTPHPDFMHRIGDLIVVPRLNTRLVDASRLPSAVSIHSGMSDAEMLVPLLTKRI